ncbi:MAG: helix-hairpin-helix domain-containing protein [Bacteroidota bacterium]
MSKNIFQEYFHFTRTERNGFFILCVLSLIGLLSPHIYKYFHKEPMQDFEAFHQKWAKHTQDKSSIASSINPSLKLRPFNPNQTSEAVLLAMNLPDRLVRNLVKYRQKGGRIRRLSQLQKIYGMTEELYQQIEPFVVLKNTSSKRPVRTTSVAYQAKKPTDSLFHFDPNLADQQTLQTLGFSPKVVRTILNYRQKGGRFRKAEDLSKIYGLSTTTFDRIAPYISLKDTDVQSLKSPTKSNRKIDIVKPIVDINQADQQSWEQLYGIGPTYAKRIVNFRNKLGGFASIEQVGETYYLPDSTFQKIRPQLRLSPIFKQISINQATVKELFAHPYINTKEARLIVSYRDQHGPYKEGEDLQKIKVISKDRLQKMTPYFNFSY